MKINRQRAFKRHSSLYKTHFGFRVPYQVILDANFIHQARKGGLDLSRQLTSMLSATTVLYVTRCALMELKQLSRQSEQGDEAQEFKETLDHIRDISAKTLYCGHKKPLGVSSCILSLIGERNHSHYFIASQHRPLQDKLDEIPGTPVIYIKSNALHLKPYSTSTQDKLKAIQESRMKVPQEEKKVIQKIAPVEKVEIRPRKRKAMAPNPLSCKAKKPRLTDDKAKSTGRTDQRIKKDTSKKHSGIKNPTAKEA